MTYEPKIEFKPNPFRVRNQISTIQPIDQIHPLALAAEEIVCDCVQIVAEQTKLAKESKSVTKTNDHLDAARKAMSLVSMIRTQMPEADEAFIHRFLVMMARATERMTRAELYKEYLYYCDSKGILPIGKTAFFGLVQDKFGVTFSRRGSGELMGVIAVLPQIQD